MSFSLKYVGKKSDFVGKTLWEILGNLKNFGVGRIVVRNTYAKKFKEPCYMKILEVTTRPHWEESKLKKYRPPNDLRDKDRPRKINVKCEYIYRGVKFDEPIEITRESGFPDYSLIPKHLESNYTFSRTRTQRIEERILPRYIELPPVLKMIHSENGVEDPKMRTITNKCWYSVHRVAEENEQPTLKFPNKFETPTTSSNLYKDVNYNV